MNTRTITFLATALCAAFSAHSQQNDLSNTDFSNKHGLLTADSNFTSSETSLPTMEENRSTETITDDQFFSISAEAFFPGSNLQYTNTYGMGGAYIKETVFGALVAHVHLPHGATVKEFKVYFYDNSSKDLNVRLMGLRLDGGAFWPMATVLSTGITGYGNQSTTSISYSVIDNTTFGYLIYAYCSPWDITGNLRLMGATIRYTPSAAPVR